MFHHLFNLTLQQELLVIEMKEFRNFCQQMFDFSILFAFENIYNKKSL